MKTLHYTLEQLATSTPGGIGRYGVELFRHMAASTPGNWELIGVLPEGYNRENLNIDVSLRQHRIPTKILSRAWSRGFLLGNRTENVHSPSLLAPLGSHSRSGKSVVTIHDAVPWQQPETLTKHGAMWHNTMALRAERFADAIVVPTESVKQQLSELFDFEDRLVIIPGASSLRKSPLSDQDSELLESLPQDFFLMVGTLEPRKGFDVALKAVSLSNSLPLVHVGPRGWGNVTTQVKEDLAQSSSFLQLGYVSENLLAHLYSHATALLLPSQNEGFGLPLLEALQFGTPGIISNVPALEEVGGTAVLVADRFSSTFTEELAHHLTVIATDDKVRAALQKQAPLQSEKYSWESSAQKAWNLHLNL